MMSKLIRVIIKYKKIILILIFAFVTGVFAVLRVSIGFGPFLLSGLILYYLLWAYFKELKWTRYLSHFMIIAFIAWFISFVVIEGAVIADSKADKALKGDYVLVLGAGLKGDVPAISLESRLEKTAEYLKQDKNIKVIVSGGQGKDETISEAEAMRKYLIQEGIKADRIIKEEKATSTNENLIFTKVIIDSLENNRDYKVIIITSDYHVFRTKLIAKRLGIEAACLPSKTPFVVYVNGCVREYFALINTYFG